MILQIGVIDVPEPEGGSSFEVAQSLEKRYHLFSAFAATNIDFIAKELTQDATNMFSALLNGEPTGAAFADAGDSITNRFKQFISLGEDESIGLVGVPTQAALSGVTLRTKNKKSISKVRKGAKYVRVYGAKRPSFIYSGIMQASLKCWVE